MKKINCVRMMLQMPEKTKDVIEEITNRTHSASMAETIRIGIALLDVVSHERQQGGELYVHHADGKQSKIIII